MGYPSGRTECRMWVQRLRPGCAVRPWSVLWPAALEEFLK